LVSNVTDGKYVELYRISGHIRQAVKDFEAQGVKVLKQLFL